MTEAQIVLRFSIKRGISVIPKSTNPDRMKANAEIFDLKLSDEDMKSLQSLNKNLRFNNPAIYCEQVFNTFYPIFD